MMSRGAILLVAGFTACSGIRRKTSSPVGDCFSPYDGKALLKVSSCAEAESKSLQDLMEAASCTDLDDEGIALLGRGGCSSVQVICPSSAAERMMESYSASVEVVSPDAGAHLRATSPQIEPFVQTRGVDAAASFYNSFRNLADQENKVKESVAASGGRAKLETVGYSVEGRPIKAVRITGSGYSKGKPRVVLTFNVHAREWVAGMSGTYAVDKLTAKAASDFNYFKNTEVVIIPMGNPDGFYYSTTSDRMWRKNKAKTGSWFCEGVDLNRNFPKGWGGPHSTSSSKCSDVYFGPSALSEPESKAIASVIDESPVTVYIDIHCYGRYILKPWSYTNNKHPRDAEVEDLGWKMLAAMKSSRNNRFQYGGNELLGRASGVLPDYANGGLGYTYELTTAFDPPTSEIKPSAVECLDGIYAAIDWSKASAR